MNQPVLNAICGNRWTIAAAGTLLQVCLGTVYAWSFFQRPLVDGFGWSNAQTAWTFSLTICFLGLAAAWGGQRLARFGPRRLAMLGGLLFGTGHFIAALALHWKSLPLLYLGYGVLGGCGLGLGYVTPVATVAAWFPDRKGLMTGMVIMGFGFGALAMSKLFAPLLYQASDGNLVVVFASLGGFFLVSVPSLGAMLRMPPPTSSTTPRNAGPMVPSLSAENSEQDDRCSTAKTLLGRRFLTVWLMFFANILAGISLISFQSPLLQDMWRNYTPGLSAKTLAAYGATLIAVSSLFNGVGRIAWGGVSDGAGRLRTFQLMFATQIVAFVGLVYVGNPWLFAAMICYVLFCYGGGFGTMPSLISEMFGTTRMPVVYGAVLTAWSAAGIVGPQLVAWVNDHDPSHGAQYAFVCNIVALAFGLLLASTLRDDRLQTE